MDKIKCECGHVNPEGTVLCEACGKPIEGNQHIDGNDSKKLLNMRYEGSARRSQTYNKSIIDKIWSFFSSVKVGVWLIVIALIASAIGTIYPQEPYIPADAISRDPAIYYEAQYGLTGKIFYQLGFHNLYSSWWYMLLLALIGISLVICSLDRFVPLYKALKIQKAKRHESFLRRQRFYSQTEYVTQEEKQTVIDRLKKQRYNVRDENGHILAEKGRFSRWGPYVNHIGLIIILIAALLRTTPLMYLDEYIWLDEGEEKVIPGTDGKYYIENKQFVLETYDEDDERFQEAIAQEGRLIPKNFQTDVVVYKTDGNNITGTEDREKYKEYDIRMNHPLKFNGYSLYQSGYQLNKFAEITFSIYEENDTDAKPLDQFTVDLSDPKSEYELENGFHVEILQYYPDYYLDDGEPASKTDDPNNPAFVFKVVPPENKEPETSFVGDVIRVAEEIGIDPENQELAPMSNVLGQFATNISATEDNKYRVSIEDIEFKKTSGITVRRDYTLPLFGLGAIIFMIGVVQGMYWQHRRIWIRPKDEGIMLAAHTNKNWFGLRKDIEKAIAETRINMVEDQQELDS